MATARHAWLETPAAGRNICTGRTAGMGTAICAPKREGVGNDAASEGRSARAASRQQTALKIQTEPLSGVVGGGGSDGGGGIMGLRQGLLARELRVGKFKSLDCWECDRDTVSPAPPLNNKNQ